MLCARALASFSAAVALTVLPALAGPALAAPAVEITPASELAQPVFAVKYTGSSRTHTVYRGTPPNPGGGPDLNRANDRGRTSWALTFPDGLALPVCSSGADDPCAGVRGVTNASGKTSAVGDVDHTHDDGLYEQLDSTSRCRPRAKAVPRSGLDARIDVVHDVAAASWVVTARNPVGTALIMQPDACRSPVDGIDRILGNYFEPGFSYAQDFGADRWFTSASVAIPDATWRSSSRIRLRLGPTTAGTPPRNCATRFTYERCRTTGHWSGVLTFTRRL